VLLWSEEEEEGEKKGICQVKKRICLFIVCLYGYCSPTVLF
jgi:hypothetical protein